MADTATSEHLRWNRACVGAGIIAAGLFCGDVGDVRATTIVMVHTAEQVVIAADSEGTFSGKRLPTTTVQVCKIFSTDRAVFAISGIAGDPTNDFSPPDIVAKGLKGDSPIGNRLHDIEQTIGTSLVADLPHLHAIDPEGHALLLRDKVAISMMVGVVEKGTIAVTGFSVVLASSEGTPKFEITEAGPGEIMYGGQIANIQQNERSLIKPGMTAIDVARALVQIEIEKHAPGVGGPVDVVVLTKDGRHTSDAKPGCPIDVDHP